MVNVNSPEIYNQSSAVSGTPSGVSGSYVRKSDMSRESAVSQAVRDIQSLMEGEAFNGQVESVDGNTVTLKLFGGGQLNASLQGQVNITEGQNLTFIVTGNNGSTITLKPIQLIDEQTSYVAGRALEAAGLADNPANEEIVKELLNQNMSISSATLNDIARAAARYPDTGLDTLTRLYKLDIPITRENIQQFEAYKSYENRISGDILNLADGLSQAFADSLAENGVRGLLDISGSVINILYEEDMTKALPGDAQTEGRQAAVNGPETAAEGMADKAQNTAADKGAAPDAGELISKFLDKDAQNELKEMLNDSFKGLNEEFTKGLADKAGSGNLSAREFMESLNELLSSASMSADEHSIDRESLSSLLKSDAFKGIMEMVMRDTMHISPKDVKEKDAVKDFYEKVRDNVDKLSRAVEDKAGSDSQLSKSLSSVKENIDFMNELNKNMTFFQIPIKFSENNANGELYVFTNKKSLRQNKDDISALLHLDMDNLGPVDVFVRLKGRNVTTNFCLASEELLDFVYSQIDRLSERLEKLGYNCKFEMKVREGERSADFVEDFIDMDLPKVLATTQLVFDRKV